MVTQSQLPGYHVNNCESLACHQRPERFNMFFICIIRLSIPAGHSALQLPWLLILFNCLSLFIFCVKSLVPAIRKKDLYCTKTTMSIANKELELELYKAVL